MIEITSGELKEKITKGENFVLDLYATWCGPCKVMSNTLGSVDSVSSTEGEKFTIYKLDIDTDRDFIIGDLGVRSVPTIKFFRNGLEFYSRSGIMSQSDIINSLSKN